MSELKVKKRMWTCPICGLLFGSKKAFLDRHRHTMREIGNNLDKLTRKEKK